MDVETFLERLEGVTGAGPWKARCPAHDDRVQSLSVSENETGIMVYCHAGCETEDVLSELGLTWKDIFHRRSTEEPEAVYPYHDEQGKLLFEVVRFPGKKFRQRTPDGKWGLNGAQRVPYNLPLNYSDPSVVYVVEGEKDVEIFRTRGLTATCNPGGAGKWLPEYAHYFQGIPRVIIVADNDEPGEKHSLQVKESLVGTVPDVRIVRPKVGKDASDHFEAGYGVQDFVPSEGLFVVSANEVKAEHVEFLDKDGRVPLRGITALVGMPGLGKSQWACYLAAEVTKRGGYALFSTMEDPHGSVLKPRLAAAGADLAKVGFPALRFGDDERNLILPEDVEALEQAVAQYGAELVVIDPLMAHLSEGVNPNLDQSVRRALHPLTQMADRCKCAVIGIQHPNKSMSPNAMVRVGGSLGGIMGAVRSALELEVYGGSESHLLRQLVHFKSSWGNYAQPQTYHIEGKIVDLDGLQIDSARIVPGFAPQRVADAEGNVWEDLW